ncbi:CDC27 family protein [Halobacteriovorax sp. JY17]|uniref:tetratricopeptide repeat protein n=1 Tax=Halobacteriovorax sp. JY17 TaxID=2014617 RepID=UPI000C60088E|nr:CDC27 family protein [Halobacteriovorax sp. JY17]PIK14482.1 MAG: hypothetical protein CES88_09055 [Halobacteriovorax sp. JY17]
MAQKSQILDKYLTALEKDPRSRVFAPLAEYYRKSGLLTQAIETLNQGIRHNPDYVLGHLGLAFCYFENGDSKRSYDILKPLIGSNRDNLRMLRLFSDVCLELKKSEEALETLKYLLFVNPKDLQAAESVKALENENKKFGPIKFNLQDVLEEKSSEDVLSKSVQFNVDDLNTNLNNEKKIDEWTKLDLSGEKSEEVDLDSWSMNERPSFHDKESEAKNEEVERVFKVEQPKVENVKSSTPVITHTLVDLYCNQGYLDKAKDLLEKILELNPNDLKTKLKLQEVDRVLGESFIDENLDEEEVLEEEIERLDVASVDTDEITGRNNLMNLFDEKFNKEKSDIELIEEGNEEVVDPLYSEKVKVIEEKLWAFHRSLCAKAKSVLSV